MRLRNNFSKVYSLTQMKRSVRKKFFDKLLIAKNIEHLIITIYYQNIIQEQDNIDIRVFVIIKGLRTLCFT